MHDYQATVLLRTRRRVNARRSARHGLRWFEFDATWWAIKTLEMLRLAHDVKVPATAMLERRIRPRKLASTVR